MQRVFLFTPSTTSIRIVAVAEGHFYCCDLPHTVTSNNLRNNPQQRNGNDCGVFLISSLICMSQGLDIGSLVSQSSMARWRTRITRLLQDGIFPLEFD